MKRTKFANKLWLAALMVALLATLLCFAAGAETVSGTCGAEGDNLTWTLDTETGDLVISGTGAMKDYTLDSAPWFFYGSFIKRAIIENGVTSIGEWAFPGCDLTSATIPNSVASIGYRAFYNCSSLTSVLIGNNVTNIGDYAFAFTGLTSIDIPDSVTSIGDSAFTCCDSLTSVTIPDSVTSIGDGVFYACSSLTSASIGNSVTSIGYRAFSNCSSLTSMTIPMGVTSIGDCAFESCSNLDDVTIPDSVTSIGNLAFYACSSLTSMTFPMGVTSIGDSAFYACSSLTNVSIPESVTSIGDRAFFGCSSLIYSIYENAKYLGNKENSFICLIDTINTNITTCNIHTTTKIIYHDAFLHCSSLTSVTIPDSVTSIGGKAFEDCSSLSTITVDENNPIYHSEGNCIIETASKVLVIGCKNSVIPSDGSVTSIGDHAFFDCSNLASVTIPDSVTSIGQYAFCDCDSLEGVTIPDSVTSIGNSAFYDCDSLESVTIEYGVTSIGQGAFYNCSRLEDVTMPNSVQSIGDSAFSDCSSLLRVTVLSKNVSIYDSSFIFPASATIYGYAGSTTEEYATKYDRPFVALNEKTDGTVISYQVTKGENGAFSLRVISGLNSLNYTNCGFEITVTTKDADGNDMIQTVSGTDDKAYSSVFGGNTAYSIKEYFAYNYAALATVTGLAVNSEYTKLAIRSYVVSNGEKLYGNGVTLMYTGEQNSLGFPILTMATLTVESASIINKKISAVSPTHEFSITPLITQIGGDYEINAAGDKLVAKTALVDENGAALDGKIDTIAEYKAAYGDLSMIDTALYEDKLSTVEKNIKGADDTIDDLMGTFETLLDGKSTVLVTMNNVSEITRLRELLVKWLQVGNRNMILATPVKNENDVITGYTLASILETYADKYETTVDNIVNYILDYTSYNEASATKDAGPILRLSHKANVLKKEAAIVVSAYNMIDRIYTYNNTAFAFDNSIYGVVAKLNSATNSNLALYGLTSYETTSEIVDDNTWYGYKMSFVSFNTDKDGFYERKIDSLASGEKYASADDALAAARTYIKGQMIDGALDISSEEDFYNYLFDENGYLQSTIKATDAEDLNSVFKDKAIPSFVLPMMASYLDSKFVVNNMGETTENITLAKKYGWELESNGYGFSYIKAMVYNLLKVEGEGMISASNLAAIQKATDYESLKLVVKVICIDDLDRSHGVTLGHANVSWLSKTYDLGVKKFADGTTVTIADQATVYAEHGVDLEQLVANAFTFYVE